MKSKKPKLLTVEFKQELIKDSLIHVKDLGTSSINAIGNSPILAGSLIAAITALLIRLKLKTDGGFQLPFGTGRTITAIKDDLLQPFPFLPTPSETKISLLPFGPMVYQAQKSIFDILTMLNPITRR